MIVNVDTHRKPSLLICDDDQSYILALKSFLKSHYEVRSAFHSDEAIAILKNNHIDLIILDIQMRTNDEGLKAIPKIREINDDVSIVISSGLTEFSCVREAIQMGALDYISKESGPDELLHSIARVFEKRKLLKRRAQQNFEVKTHQKKNILIGKHPQIESLKRLIEKVRSSRANIVIYGETGTGKEVVARMLRSESEDGSLAPFVAVDSATIHSETAESILFGHEKGAFTGADKPRKGVFEEADGGIIYFDELANMTSTIQAKLLRVIQEKEVTRLGSARSIPLDFRVIAATNKNLDALVQQGLFKDDLYQRLNVIPISIPPLRDRKEDIPLLIDYFCQQQSTMGISLSFTASAMNLLLNYSWPGNVRELQNLISYLAAVSEIEEIDRNDLPAKFAENPTPSRSQFQVPVQGSSLPGTAPNAGPSFYDQVGHFEAETLRSAHLQTGGNISKLAEMLQMDRSHLYAKLKLYKIHEPHSKTKSETP